MAKSLKTLFFLMRRIRKIVKQYAVEAGIEKRVYPHLSLNGLVHQYEKRI